jgi:hypothetical protein
LAAPSEDDDNASCFNSTDAASCPDQRRQCQLAQQQQRRQWLSQAKTMTVAAASPQTLGQVCHFPSFFLSFFQSSFHFSFRYKLAVQGPVRGHDNDYDDDSWLNNNSNSAGCLPTNHREQVRHFLFFFYLSFFFL